jgi:hypothetical protein
MSKRDIDSNCDVLREMFKKKDLDDDQDRIVVFTAALALVQRALLDLNRIADAAEYCVQQDVAEQRNTRGGRE